MPDAPDSCDAVNELSSLQGIIQGVFELESRQRKMLPFVENKTALNLAADLAAKKSGEQTFF